MDQAVWFRWLGVVGIKVRVNEQILAIDPFLTRPPLRRLWFGHVHSDSALVATTIPQCPRDAQRDCCKKAIVCESAS